MSKVSLEIFKMKLLLEFSRKNENIHLMKPQNGMNDFLKHLDMIAIALIIISFQLISPSSDRKFKSQREENLIWSRKINIKKLKTNLMRFERNLAFHFLPFNVVGREKFIKV